MNQIKISSLQSLGYQFIPEQYIPEGKDEYYLRNIQNRSGIQFRQLSAFEIEVLVRNRNTSDNWNMIWVSEEFNPELVKNCKFYGLVRIGKLEPLYLEFSDLKVAVGLYNSTIISTDIGNNCVVNNVHYLSHYILGDQVILSNINEIQTTGKAKFGNGILKEGEEENSRIWLEICNENGGRKIIPFNSMLAGDAWIWSKYRDEPELLQKFIEFTELEFKTERGYYGKIGDRSVIKNTNVIKDVWIGSDAYIKGANKLKNLTINSSKNSKTQIGEGCELVNGCVGFGCRIFYGSKAVRFIMASHSQLKYGARLINSYLGNNATVSCCEVLNSLIFPGHEQHHNNSFLCASVVMGQSNIPAGATIGSNHNSRSADGEMIAGRGFWPGLCVSLKHNSKFSSFNMIAKGDYESELNCSIPFSLISIDHSDNALQIMPGYWFMYNMYALARNEWKYVERDQRILKIQRIEYDYLAPDTVNEMFSALVLFEEAVGKAYLKKHPDFKVQDSIINTGKNLLLHHENEVNSLEILVSGIENSKRPVRILKVHKAYHLFKKMINYYAIKQFMNYLTYPLFEEFKKKSKRYAFVNIGGQLIPEPSVDKFKADIKNGEISSWEEVHQFYRFMGKEYDMDKFNHAKACFEELNGVDLSSFVEKDFIPYLKEHIETNTWITEQIIASRAKDYQNEFRKMVYDNEVEMEAVLGKLKENSFLRDSYTKSDFYHYEIKGKISELKEGLDESF